MLLPRAILAFLALPAPVGFAIPIWSVLWASRTLIIYSVSFAIGFHLRVVLYEEPWASRRFGAQWDAYRARVPRWII